MFYYVILCQCLTIVRSSSFRDILLKSGPFNLDVFAAFTFYHRVFRQTITSVEVWRARCRNLEWESFREHDFVRILVQLVERGS